MTSEGGGRTDPLSRTALKALRLKPAPGQVPAKTVYSRRRREHIELFDPALCVPMRQARTPTPAQLDALRAGRMVHTHSACACCGIEHLRDSLTLEGLCMPCAAAELAAERAARDIRRLADLRSLLLRGASPRKTIYLDTETTGLSPLGDELLEVAAIDDGEVVFHSLVKPTRLKEWPEAELIHGISPSDVQNAPTLGDLLPELAQVLLSAEALVVYNAPFDLAFLPEGLRNSIEPATLCAMEAFALHVGQWDERREAFRWHSLAAASSIAEHFWTGSQHRAVADAVATRAVWQWLQQQNARIAAKS
ncbi:3'-5' exonuclease [Ideonella sp. B508-1]|uniref:3'-5' exonuclease n=1 Tax=Ideonella sp. B508-1 TaxID=137716 RepID=UPI0003B362F3|nr:3'-5' exonuclease [Ideonella sp. B508-1]